MNWSEIPRRHCCRRPALVAAVLAGLAVYPAGAQEPMVADGGPVAGPQRYAEVLDGDGEPAAEGFQRRVGGVVVTFDSSETDALVAAGWQPLAPAAADDFADHGDRVTTFVAIAVALGLDPAAGAHQANWGTPQEIEQGGLTPSASAMRYGRDVARYDIAELERHREDAASVLAGMRAALTADGAADGAAAAAGTEDMAATIAALEAEIANVDRQLSERRARVAALDVELARLESDPTAATAPAVDAPPAGWADANLDVNGDGRVNRADLEAALDAAPNTGQPSDQDGTVAE